MQHVISRLNRPQAGLRCTIAGFFLVLARLAAGQQLPVHRPAISSSVVISQVYAGGGNSNAAYKNDFVELFNRGSSPVDLTGWMVQHAAAGSAFSAGSSSNVALAGTLLPGRYYLIKLAGGSMGDELPAADASGGINMGSSGGKVALANNGEVVVGATGTNVVDFVGYGNAKDYEGGKPAPTPSTNDRSTSRISGGCTDTDDNGNDFATGAANPRNIASPTKVCDATLTADPTALAGFVAASNAPSDEQSYTLTGVGLSAAVTVKAPAGYRVALTTGGPYAATVTTDSPTNGSLTADVFVVLDGTTAGSTTGTITNTSNATTVSVAVSGMVNAPAGSPETVFWTGRAGTEFWFDAANWSTNAVPAANADVVLDHRTVRGQYRVLLQSAATPAGSEASVAILSLLVAPGAGDSIFFEVPAANTNDSALTITRSNAGENALIIQSKGVVTNAAGNGGANSTNGPGITVVGNKPTVYIYDGGTYRHYTNRSHAGVVENLAPAPGTERGIWEFRVTNTSSYSLSLSNRSYPTLVLRNNPTAAATSYTGSGKALTIRGNLLIGPNVTFSPNITTGEFRLAGDLTAQGSLRFSPSTSGKPATGRLVLNGAAPQVISGATFGTPGAGSYLSAGVTLQINNSQGVRLATPVTVNGTLQLTTGQLTTDATNLLTLGAGAGISGGSTTSFVNGPVAATANGPTTLQFPLGQLSRQGTVVYRPLALNITTLATPITFIATQEEGRATGPLNGNLTRVSARRSFTVTPTPALADGAFAGTITLSFGPDDQVTNPESPTLVVAKNSGTGWENIGRSTYTGAADNGTLTSDPFTTFSRFALASTNPDNKQNPLPVELTKFTAQRTSTGALLRWTTASEQNCLRYEVLRSPDGTSFSSVGSQPGNGTTAQQHSYQHQDAVAPTDAAYYKLRQVDLNGSATYSPVVFLPAGTGSGSFYPNPVRQQFTLALPAAGTLRLINELGQVAYQADAAAGPTVHIVARLPAGVYVLEIQLPGQPTQRQRLLKLE